MRAYPILRNGVEQRLKVFNPDSNLSTLVSRNIAFKSKLSLSLFPELQPILRAFLVQNDNLNTRR